MSEQPRGSKCRKCRKACKQPSPFVVQSCRDFERQDKDKNTPDTTKAS